MIIMVTLYEGSGYYIPPCSDTTANGEVTTGQSTTMKPDLNCTGAGAGGRVSTDFFDMVPSTGVGYSGQFVVIIVIWYY